MHCTPFLVLFWWCGATVTSVERMINYTELTPEAPPVTDVRPPEGWPSRGEIVFNKMSLIYPDTTEPVLRGAARSRQRSVPTPATAFSRAHGTTGRFGSTRHHADCAPRRESGHRGPHRSWQELAHCIAVPGRRADPGRLRGGASLSSCPRRDRPRSLRLPAVAHVFRSTASCARRWACSTFGRACRSFHRSELRPAATMPPMRIDADGRGSCRTYLDILCV